MTDEILVEKRGAVAILTLNRPDTLNAVTIPMTKTMMDTYEALNDDSDVRVLIFTGAGKGFCSGLDIKAHSLADPNRHSPYRMLNYNQHSIGRIRQFAKPTIAAVNGVAAGAGLGIALACDIRIVSEAARFSAIFAKRGLPPQDAVAAFLPEIVGVSRALEMIYTARMVGADEALSIGLANEVVPAERLLDRAIELAEQIAAGPPVALAMAKQVVYRGLGKHLDDQLALQNLGSFLNASYAADDLREAGQAFVERRTPQFKGT